MRGVWRAAVLACVVSGLISRPGDTAATPANPDSGRVIDGAYRNAYFDLTYRLPPGWVEGTGGPSPSASGYYVLGSFVPKDELTGTLLIAAQDIFFAAKPFSTAAAIMHDFARATSAVAGMTIDRGASEVRIAGRQFSRVDFSGVGLHRALFVTEIRCHLVSFTLTSRDPALLAKLALSLDALSFGADDEAAAPVCIKNYANGDNLLRRIEPIASGPKFAPVPVRIIIGTDGSVAHIHVINATQEQRTAIEEALTQWRFAPPIAEGRPAEVETGLVFGLTPASQPAAR